MEMERAERGFLKIFQSYSLEFVPLVILPRRGIASPPRAPVLEPLFEWILLAGLVETVIW